MLRQIFWPILIFMWINYSCKCRDLETFVAPIVDNKGAPLVAIVNTTNISSHIVRSIEMPLREIINTTVECKLDEKLKEDIVSSQVFGNVNNKFDSLQYQMNEFKQDFATLRKEMEELKKLTNTVSIENKDIAEKLEGLNANVNSRVALSACGASYTSISPKTTVTFSNIITSEGITNQYLTSFKSSGVFVCEVPGLYHISVVIMSPANGAYLKIYKNNNKLIRLYIDSYYDDGHRQEYHSNAAIVVTELQKDDTIDIKPGGNKDIYIHHTYSCLTILKVK